MKKRLTSLFLALMLMLSLCVTAFADFGDYGGDSDYGDYDYGSYDYGSYDNDYYYYYDDDDSNQNSKYYSYVLSSHDEDDGFGGYYNSKSEKISLSSLDRSVEDDENADFTAAALFIAVGGSIAVVVRKRRKYNKLYTKSRPAGAQPTDISAFNNMATYAKVDPNFSVSDLKEKLSNMYVQMQNGWQAKNIEQLRPYFTDALFAQFDRQLDAYRRNKQTNCIERIAVLDVDLKGWKQEAGVDTIIATMRTRIVDYVVDDNTGKVVRGSNTAEKFMTYEWTLTRKSGVQTDVNSGTRVVTCPNCGATLNINKSAKCEYCGSVITVDSVDWAISQIKGISQNTVK